MALYDRASVTPDQLRNPEKYNTVRTSGAGSATGGGGAGTSASSTLTLTAAQKAAQAAALAAAQKAAAAAGGGATGGTTTTVPAPAAGNVTANPLSLTAAPSPEMAKAAADYQAQQALLAKTFGDRMSADDTQRLMDRAAGAIRTQAAGMGAQADIEGAKNGRGPGFAAGSIGEAAQRNAAKAGADIQLAQQNRLDTLANQQAGLTNQLYAANPWLSTAQLGLSQQNLSLDAWKAQQDALARQQQLGLQQQQINQAANGTPMDWYRLIYGGLGL